MDGWMSLVIIQSCLIYPLSNERCVAIFKNFYLFCSKILKYPSLYFFFLICSLDVQEIQQVRNKNKEEGKPSISKVSVVIIASVKDSTRV